MAKKIVRSITGIKDINEQGFDTNNVNDLLSDGIHNYIHRKKIGNDEYHNLTDNIKTIYADDDTLLTVTNDGYNYNKATLHPKHDAQKEQVLESERNTITINHGTNATAEKTKVDTNPQKVLEHGNLIANADSGLDVSHQDGANTTNIGLSEEFLKNNAQYLASSNGSITVEQTQSKYGKNYDVKLSQDIINTINAKTDTIRNITGALDGFGAYTIVNIPINNSYQAFVQIVQNNIEDTFTVGDNHQLYKYLNSLDFFGRSVFKSGDILITKADKSFTLSNDNTNGTGNTSYVRLTTLITLVNK